MGRKWQTHTEKEKFAACVADMKGKPGEMSKVHYFIEQQKNCYESAKTELERQREIAEQTGFKATGTDGYGFGWWDTPKSVENARNNRIEDERNGIARKAGRRLKWRHC